MSLVTNEELKEFLEQMQWHINNKLDKTRFEMMELRKKVDFMDAKLEGVLKEQNGLVPRHRENGVIEEEDEEEERKEVESKGGGKGGGIRRGNSAFARSIKGVFMNSNNNKQEKRANAGVEEETSERKKVVTFGQDVVVQEMHRVLSGKKKLKKVPRTALIEELREENGEEETGNDSDENKDLDDEDIDDFTDSDDEMQTGEGNVNMC